jgi:transposase
MSTAFIKGVAEHLPNARITFDKFHVVAQASAAVDQTRRLEQRTDPSLKGLRWTLLKDRHRLSAESRADLDALIAQATSKRTARAWLYREHLREILERKQINVVSGLLKQWCTNVLRSKSLPSRRRGSSR